MVGFGSQVPLSTPTPYPVSLTRLTPVGARLAMHVGLLSMRPRGEEAAIWLLLLDRPTFQNWFYHLLFLWSWASHSIEGIFHFCSQVVYRSGTEYENYLTHSLASDVPDMQAAIMETSPKAFCGKEAASAKQGLKCSWLFKVGGAFELLLKTP